MKNKTYFGVIYSLINRSFFCSKKLTICFHSVAKFIGISRYTIMLIETKKRRMTWNTFLSLVLLFDKNEDTAVLLRALEIYTDELDNMLKQQTDANH